MVLKLVYHFDVLELSRKLKVSAGVIRGYLTNYKRDPQFIFELESRQAAVQQK